jgi:hypothetical protein
MSFIAADPGLGISSGIGGGFNTYAVAPPTMGTLIAEVQLNPASQFLGIADTTPQLQGGGFTLRTEPPPAGNPSPISDDGRTVDGVFKPND